MKMIHIEEVMGRAQRCFAVVRTGVKVGASNIFFLLTSFFVRSTMYQQAGYLLTFWTFTLDHCQLYCSSDH